MKQQLDPFDVGVLVGVLIGEGHFGGDGKQPQVTLRMHTDHETLFFWLRDLVPGSKLYGPYEHGKRKYYQWMVRGEPLRSFLVPLLRERLSPDLDEKAYKRFHAMVERYAL